MKKVLCGMVTILLFLSLMPTVSAYEADPDSPVYAACAAVAADMDASHILVYNYTDDELLYSRTLEGGKIYPASITKLFSAYVALQILQPDDEITVGSELNLLQEGSSVAYLARGQKLTVSMLVEGMLLPSGNDAALTLSAAAGRAVSEADSLSDREAVDEFVAEMNRRAEELGFEKSHFANPDGYHTGCHYTSIPDLVRIARLALENPTISSIMGCNEIKELFLSGQAITWNNTNLLLEPKEKYYHPEAIGMKTGYTSQAQSCLMTAFYSEDTVIVVGILGTKNAASRFTDAVRLLDAWRNNP